MTHLAFRYLLHCVQSLRGGGGDLLIHSVRKPTDSVTSSLSRSSVSFCLCNGLVLRPPPSIIPAMEDLSGAARVSLERFFWNAFWLRRRAISTSESFCGTFSYAGTSLPQFSVIYVCFLINDMIFTRRGNKSVTCTKSGILRHGNCKHYEVKCEKRKKALQWVPANINT